MPEPSRPAPALDPCETTYPNRFLAHADHTVPEAMRVIVPHVADRVAVDTGEEQITFGELHDRAAQVAHALLERCPDPDVPVFILCDAGIAPVLAVCGALYGGVIAAPVDVREPADRLHKLFGLSGAQCVVADRAHADIASTLHDRVILLDETASYDTSLPQLDLPLERPGLIPFTSGSTGTPKACFWSHRDMVERGGWNRGERLAPGDRVAITTSWGFLAAQILLFAGLLNGATSCVYDLRSRGARGLPAWARDNRIVTMQLAPSVVRAFAPTTPPGMLGCVRRLGLVSETLQWSDVALARELVGPETVLVNTFGSSEIGVVASYQIPTDAIPDDDPVPVGVPPPFVDVFLVDDDDRPVAAGEAGRFVVVRDGPLARGYWRDPDLTARTFHTRPDGRFEFRMSDRGRLRPDGLFEHIGRLDSRVKVRGAMVATSEVEVALMALDDVADAAVVAAPDGGGTTHLVAYVVAEPGRPLSAWKLRRDIAQRLPTTMVPAAYVALEELPRTVRHKIDRAALPPPPPPSSTTPYRAPLGNDADLAAIFAAVLGVECVGLDDDFFEMGGDSLGVVELLAGIADRFSVDLPASVVLDAPTVAQLALRLSHRRSRDSSPVVPLRIDRPGPPFFCVTGGGAPAVSLRALSEAMPGQNFFAIQARGLEERALPDHSIGAAARRNLLALRDVQRTGPYLLGGYSYGGLVAFEMACRLRALGEDVAMLVVLDIGAPGHDTTVTNRVKARTRALRADTSAGRVRRAASVAARTGRLAGTSAYAHAERRVALSSAGLFPRRGYHQYDLFLRLHTRMAVEYDPTTTFDGPVLLVRGGRGDFGWSRLVTGPLSVVDVPADHLGLVRTPLVEQVGQIVADVLSTQAAGVGS